MNRRALVVHDDLLFANLAKFIGPVYDHREAIRLSEERGAGRCGLDAFGRGGDADQSQSGVDGGANLTRRRRV